MRCFDVPALKCLNIPRLVAQLLIENPPVPAVLLFLFTGNKVLRTRRAGALLNHLGLDMTYRLALRRKLTFFGVGHLLCFHEGEFLGFFVDLPNALLVLRGEG